MQGLGLQGFGAMIGAIMELSRDGVDHDPKKTRVFGNTKMSCHVPFSFLLDSPLWVVMSIKPTANPKALNMSV